MAMMVPVPDEDQRRPYAPTSNVMAVIDRARRVNLPDRINNDYFEVIGVNEVARGRLLEALRFLRLVDEAGHPTDALRAISRAPDDELRDLLAAAVRDAYADDFARVDPAQDAQPRIIAAFRRYQPRSQTDRMVMLFLGLCRAAGMPVLDAPRERAMHAATRAATRGPTRAATGTGGAIPAVRTTRASDHAPRQPSGDSTSGLIFGLTVDDIEAMNESDFREVWTALGKVAWARGTRQRRAGTVLTEPTEEEGE
jgi:hypothetical protein